MFKDLSDQEIADTIAARKEFPGNKSAAARKLNINRATYQSRLKSFAKRGLLDTLPVMPGFEVKQTTAKFDGDGNLTAEWIQQRQESGPVFELPEGFKLSGVSAYCDADKRIRGQWLLARQDKADGVDWAQVFTDAFKDFEGRAAPVPPPESYDSSFCNFIPCNDWHVNLLNWKREVGESWDLDIAERVIGDSIAAAIERSRRAALAIVCGGGDLMHNDDNTNRTSKSHNLLDADGRHGKGLEVAQRLMVRTVDLALARNEQVEAVILPGNHDEQSSVAIKHFLRAWYRNEPRVKVINDYNRFWFRQFGGVMLAATHGDMAKLSEMPGIMAARRPETWGTTRKRYAHGFHVHHKEKLANTISGVICESHEAPIPGDSWHHAMGYLAGRSVQVITYHRDRGEYSRTIEGIMSPAEEPVSWREVA